MAALGDYSNVYNTAIAVMQQKGYRAWYDSASELYWAERDGWDFAADSPTALLGVIAIYEFIQPIEWREYWWRIDDSGADSRNLPPKPEYEPVYIRNMAP